VNFIPYWESFQTHKHIAWVKFTIEKCLSAGKFWWLLTLNFQLYLGIFLKCYLTILSVIYICVQTDMFLRPNPLGSVDLLYDSMRYGRVCTTSGREPFAFSAKHTHYILPVLSCCVMCIFSWNDPEILAFFVHLFSFRGISFDFPYSLKLWFFLEYWNL
jgi:hypothetical protein